MANADQLPNARRPAFDAPPGVRSRGPAVGPDPIPADWQGPTQQRQAATRAAMGDVGPMVEGLAPVPRGQMPLPTTGEGGAPVPRHTVRQPMLDEAPIPEEGVPIPPPSGVQARPPVGDLIYGLDTPAMPPYRHGRPTQPSSIVAPQGRVLQDTGPFAPELDIPMQWPELGPEVPMSTPDAVPYLLERLARVRAAAQDPNVTPEEYGRLGAESQAISQAIADAQARRPNALAAPVGRNLKKFMTQGRPAPRQEMGLPASPTTEAVGQMAPQPPPPPPGMGRSLKSFPKQEPAPDMTAQLARMRQYASEIPQEQATAAPSLSTPVRPPRSQRLFDKVDHRPNYLEMEPPWWEDGPAAWNALPSSRKAAIWGEGPDGGQVDAPLTYPEGERLRQAMDQDAYRRPGRFDVAPEPVALPKVPGEPGKTIPRGKPPRGVRWDPNVGERGIPTTLEQSRFLTPGVKARGGDNRQMAVDTSHFLEPRQAPDVGNTVSLRVARGNLIDVPIRETRQRGATKMAKLTRGEDGSVQRQAITKTPQKGRFQVGGLKPGDGVEFSTSYRYKDGAIYERTMHAVVRETGDGKLVLEVAPDAEAAVRPPGEAAMPPKTEAPEAPKPPGADKEALERGRKAMLAAQEFYGPNLTSGGGVPASSPKVPPIRVEEVPVGRIEVDPASYQFRQSVSAKGVDNRMAGIQEWDAEQASRRPVTLHEREDGSLYVVDGHHRVDLAKRMEAEGKPVPPLLAQIYREADGFTVADMRRKGALANIMDGSGEAVDVARVLRSGPLSEAESRKMGRVGNTALQDGEAMAKLNDEAFHLVLDGKIRPDFAAIVAREIRDARQQVEAMQDFIRRPPAGREEATAIAQEMNREGFSTVTQMGLFGEETRAASLARPIAEIATSVKRAFREDKGALGSALRNKGRLEQRGNKIDTEATAAAAQDLAALDNLFETEARLTGDVGEALRAAARDYSEGRIGRETARNRVIDAMVSHLEVLKGAKVNAAEEAPASPTLFEAAAKESSRGEEAGSATPATGGVAPGAARGDARVPGSPARVGGAPKGAPGEALPTSPGRAAKAPVAPTVPAKGGKIVTIGADLGTLTDAPVWSEAPGAKNWMATLRRDNGAPGGVKREHHDRAGGSRFTFAADELRPGDAVEFGAEVKGKGERWYGVVKEVGDQGVTFEHHPTMEAALAASRPSNGPREAKSGVSFSDIDKALDAAVSPAKRESAAKAWQGGVDKVMEKVAGVKRVEEDFETLRRAAKKWGIRSAKSQATFDPALVTDVAIRKLASRKGREQTHLLVSQDPKMAIKAPRHAAPTNANGWELLDGNFYGPLRDHYVRPDVAAELRMVRQMEEGDAFKSAMLHWKKAHTVWSPPTHVFNVLQNFVTYSLNGGRFLVEGAKGGAVWSPLAEATKVMRATTGRAAQLRRALDDAGLYEDVFVSSDLYGNAGVAKTKVGRAAQWADEKSQAAYRAEDEWIRTAYVMDRLDRAGFGDLRQMGTSAFDDAMKQAVKEAGERFYHGRTNSAGIQALADYAIPFIKVGIWANREIPAALIRNPMAVVRLSAAYYAFQQFMQMAGGESDSKTEGRKAILPASAQGVGGAITLPGGVAINTAQLNPLDPVGVPGTALTVGKMARNATGGAAAYEEKRGRLSDLGLGGPVADIADTAFDLVDQKLTSGEKTTKIGRRALGYVPGGNYAKRVGEAAYSAATGKPTSSGDTYGPGGLLATAVMGGRAISQDPVKDYERLKNRLRKAKASPDERAEALMRASQAF